MQVAYGGCGDPDTDVETKRSETFGDGNAHHEPFQVVVTCIEGGSVCTVLISKLIPKDICHHKSHR